jgi:hypothetical protein
MRDDEIEVRFECMKSETSVLEAYVQGSGRSRKEVMREMLKAWSDKKRHEWTVGCRIAGINPFAPQSDRDTNAAP